MHTLFVYGTLAQADVQIKVIGRACEMADAHLDGFVVRRGKWPYLEPQAGQSVKGWLLANLSDADMAKLDVYEEADSEHQKFDNPLYLRLRTDVQREDQSNVAAWVYFPIMENWPNQWLEGAIDG